MHRFSRTIAHPSRVRLASCAALLVVLVAVAGCASLTVNQDYDSAFNFTSFRTFAILPVTPESGINDLDASRAAAALRSELTAKGYTESEDPTFNVAYYFGRQQHTDVDSYGYGYGGYRGYGGGGVSVTQYTEGTLVIDFVDVATNSMVWRGTGQGILDDNPSPEQKTAKINDAVAKIINQFPPN